MKLEIFFDYLCEFCALAHRDWAGLFAGSPGVEPVWRPCEAHPRAEEPWGRHSDRAIQGMLFVEAQGGALPAYHDAVFAAAWQRGENIEDPAVLARCARAAGADGEALLAALADGRFLQAQLEADRYAYAVCGVRAVPTYLMEDGRRLDAVLGVGVSRRQLEALLRGAR